MENLQDSSVLSWLKGQNDYTRAALSTISGRQQLLARIEALDESVPQVGARRLPGNSYLIFKRLPGENVFKLYRRAALEGQDVLLLDPEKVTLQHDPVSRRGAPRCSGFRLFGNAVVAPGGRPDSRNPAQVRGGRLDLAAPAIRAEGIGPRHNGTSFGWPPL